MIPDKCSNISSGAHALSGRRCCPEAPGTQAAASPSPRGHAAGRHKHHVAPLLLVALHARNHLLQRAHVHAGQLLRGWAGRVFTSGSADAPECTQKGWTAAAGCERTRAWDKKALPLPKRCAHLVLVRLGQPRLVLAQPLLGGRRAPRRRLALPLRLGGSGLIGGGDGMACRRACEGWQTLCSPDEVQAC